MTDDHKVQVEVANAAYWKRQIKCQDACPVNTDARGYVRAIAVGDYETAYLIARGPNPLASMCGRVCGAPCQASCSSATGRHPGGAVTGLHRPGAPSGSAT